jgi:CDP-glycerol glycerophosphotransferase
MGKLFFIKKIIRFCRNSVNERDPAVWVCGEWFGKRVGDNAAFFANYIAEHHPAIRLHWLCDGNCDASALDKRIAVLDYSTEEAVAVSKKAAVAIMGEGISDLSHDISNYWGNALKVNLWHGVPWKKIGYDMKNARSRPPEDAIRKRLYKYDLFESPSEEYTKRILTAFGTERKCIVEAGLPRNRLFFDAGKIAACRERLARRLGAASPRIIAYLPTFRDSRTEPFSFAGVRDAAFSAWLERNNAYVVQKAHAAETGSFGAGTRHVVNMPDIPAQELMAASDMLVTDYSSCFFDYLLLDRPIVHFLRDYEYFKNEDRGLYYGKDEVVCGSAPENEADLIRAIRENFERPGLFRELRAARKAKFLTYESPDSCEIIARRIFRELEKKKFRA